MKKYPKPKKFTPKNPKKYVGNVSQIICRSSWEFKFAYWADNNPSVLEWASEEVVVPYISPLDNKPHRYFLDFWIVVKQKTGAIKKYLIEVKPESQTIEPKRGKKREKTFIYEISTYAVNSAKWKAAKAYAKKKNCEFIILTERHLGIGKS